MGKSIDKKSTMDAYNDQQIHKWVVSDWNSLPIPPLPLPPPYHIIIRRILAGLIMNKTAGPDAIPLLTSRTYKKCSVAYISFV